MSPISRFLSLTLFSACVKLHSSARMGWVVSRNNGKILPYFRIIITYRILAAKIKVTIAAGKSIQGKKEAFLRSPFILRTFKEKIS